jgi:hypothetical protein
MRLVVCLAATGLLALSPVAGAGASPTEGATSLLGAAQANQQVQVLASITSEGPVVPYAYAVLNQCWFSGRSAGHFDSTERVDLTGPWFAGPGGAAQTTVSINLQPVPAGAACRVSIVRGSTTVKGSTTSYPVAPVAP